MAGKQPGHQNISTGNVTGAIVAGMETREHLQEKISRLGKYSKDAYSERVRLLGARRFFRTPVYQLPSGKHPVGQGAGMRQELVKVRQVSGTLRSVLEQWADNTPSSRVWISDTLPVDLNIPLENVPPECIQMAACFLGMRRPPLVVTQYTCDVRDKQNAFQEARGFTRELAEELTSSLLDFCHCDFDILPCTLLCEELSVETLEREVRSRMQLSRRYYDGPQDLTKSSYEEMTAAALALAGTSYIPCFLEETQADKLWLLAMEPDLKDTLSLLVEMMKQDKSNALLTYNADSKFRVIVAVLEAAKRISYSEEIVVETADRNISDRLRKLCQHYSDDLGAPLNICTGSPDKPGAPDICLKYHNGSLAVGNGHIEWKPNTIREDVIADHHTQMPDSYNDSDDKKAGKSEIDDDSESEGKIINSVDFNHQKNVSDLLFKGKYLNYIPVFGGIADHPPEEPESDYNDSMSDDKEAGKSEIDDSEFEGLPDAERLVFSFNPETADDTGTPFITAIVVASDGRLVLTDTDNSMVKIADVTNPKRILVHGVKLHEKPHALAVLQGSSNRVAVTSNSEIIYIVCFGNSSDELSVSQIKTERDYIGICHGCAQNQLIVSCNQDEDGPARVDIIDYSGQLIKTLLDSNEIDIQGPNFLCRGDKFVFATTSDKMYKIRLDTNECEKIEGGETWPGQAAADANGSIYIASLRHRCVLKLPESGSLRPFLRSPATEEDTVIIPHGVCVSKSRIAVSWYSHDMTFCKVTGHDFEI